MTEQFKASQDVLSSLLHDVQVRAGDKFTMERIVDVDAVTLEVLVQDRASGNRFIARIYHVDKSAWVKVKEAWMQAAKPLHKPPSFLPQPSYGLKVLGDSLAHIGAFLPGYDLATYLHYVKRCRVDFSVRLVANLLRYLEALEKLGIGHYQIRPSQVWMSHQGPILLRNNGLHPFEDAVAHLDGLAPLRDLTYAAPEQIQGGDQNAATDVYLIGLLLFEMVTGRPPFVGDAAAVRDGHLNKGLPNPGSLNKDVGVGLTRILVKALAKNPAHRFQSLAEFKSTLALMLPAAERVRLNQSQQKLRIGEQEKVKVHKQLAQAKQLCDQKKVQEALKTVEAILMAVGPYDPALKFYQQIWNAVHLGTVKKALQTAQKHVQDQQPMAALVAVHHALSYMPTQPQALEMQNKIMTSLPPLPAGWRQVLPLADVLAKAEALQAANRTDAAQQLWTMVVLATAEQPDNPQRQKAMRALQGGGVSSSAAAMSPFDDDLDATVQVSDFDGPAPESPLAEPEEEALPSLDIAGFDDDENLGLADDDLPAASFDEPPATSPPRPPTPPSTSQGVSQTAPPAPAAKQTPPSTPNTPDYDHFDEDEDLLGMPPDEPPAKQPPAASAKQEKPIQADKSQHKSGGKSKLLLVAIVVGAVIIVAAGIFGFLAYRNAQENALFRQQMTAANNLESQGDLDGALAIWQQLRSEYPDRSAAEEGYRTLSYRIDARKEQLTKAITNAQQYFEDGVITDDSGENALAYLAQVFRIEPDHGQGKALLEQIRQQESARIQSLWDEEKYAEAKAAYDELAAIDPIFHDEAFQAQVDDWTFENIVKPGLSKLDRAIQRERWEEAFEITEDLRDQMRDPYVVNERWDLLMEDYQQQLQVAEEAGETETMLSLLEVMTRIRPDDIDLADRRNRLNRDYNHAKIMELEAAVSSALDAGRYVSAGKQAFALKNLDSENQVAESALAAVRRKFEDRIAASKASDPRETLKLYDQLISVFNWKNYRQERSALAKSLASFERLAKQVKSQSVTDYQRTKKAVDDFLASHTRFAAEPLYREVQNFAKELEAEHRRLQTMLAWESSAERDIGKSYVDILNRLKREKSFAFPYAQSVHRRLIDKYQQRIDNYAGKVILVIRGANNLPRESGAFRRAPDSFVELNHAGQTFKTGVVDNDENPQWDYTCNIDAEAGKPLVFKVFNQKSRGRTEQIGALRLERVPPSGRKLEMKSSDGWSLIIDVRRER